MRSPKLVAPLHREHVVIGPSTVKGGKLTFWTAGPLLASKARQAMGVGREFTVYLAANGLKEVTGKVLRVHLVEGAQTAQWEIVMRVAFTPTANFPSPV
jgi:hypothetical protein